MRFSPCVWRHDNLRGWSPQRLAAAGRAVRNEAARTQAKRDEVALFPEMVAGIQPRFTTVEQRQILIDRREAWFTTHFRESRVKAWKKARKAYFALPATRREGLRRFWQAGIYPADPTYLSTAITSFSKPGKSPWTYLRKRRLCYLWVRGFLHRPANFLSITRSFDHI